MGPLLRKINSPLDVKKLPRKKLPQLAEEIREYILEVVSINGGHLGAALGAVELTLALHYCFDCPEDKFIWDVGHQVHAHKIITGRREAFKTFRLDGGMSGFSNKDESSYDMFTTGHGGASISTSLGIAVANRIHSRKDKKVIAVIGDASIVSGMAFEGMNHAGHLKDNLIVILNDNEMSISPTVGAFSRHLNRILSNPFYNRVRKDIEKLFRKMPKVGNRMVAFGKKIDERLKSLLIPGLLFEELGFRYFGPLDGHNIEGLLQILRNISRIKGPVLLHVVTKKGKGYKIAESNPVKWHASTPFHVGTGEKKKASTQRTYTHVFGDKAIALAKKDPKIVAITAAMPDGTGLVSFGKQFPDRFFDVGLAEEHGVSFSAGLAKGGIKPLCAIYSTFLQRAHDQIIHDVALQELPVIFCIDRAGLVGADGPTHHGVFDIVYLRKIPGMTVMAPRDGRELAAMLDYAAGHTRGPIAVRYPRGAVAEESGNPLKEAPLSPIKFGKAEVLRDGNDVALLAFGSLVYPAYEAALLLEEKGIEASVVNMRFAKPLDEKIILDVTQKAKLVVTLEEGAVTGGFGSAVMEFFEKTASRDPGISFPPLRRLGIPDRFIEHGNHARLLDSIGLSAGKIKEEVLRLSASTADYARNGKSKNGASVHKKTLSPAASK